jgi:hypothetical protein
MTTSQPVQARGFAEYTPAIRLGIALGISLTACVALTLSSLREMLRPHAEQPAAIQSVLPPGPALPLATVPPPGAPPAADSVNEDSSTDTARSN